MDLFCLSNCRIAREWFMNGLESVKVAKCQAWRVTVTKGERILSASVIVVPRLGILIVLTLPHLHWYSPYQKVKYVTIFLTACIILHKKLIWTLNFVCSACELKMLWTLFMCLFIEEEFDLSYCREPLNLGRKSLQLLMFMLPEFLYNAWIFLYTPESIV